MQEHEKMPVAVLSSGVRVANFSFAVPLRFDDGAHLQECGAERLEWCRLLDSRQEWRVETASGDTFTAVRHDAQLSGRLKDALDATLDDEDVDIFLVPVEVGMAIRRSGVTWDSVFMPIPAGMGDQYRHDQFEQC